MTLQGRNPWQRVTDDPEAAQQAPEETCQYQWKIKFICISPLIKILVEVVRSDQKWPTKDFPLSPVAIIFQEFYFHHLLQLRHHCKWHHHRLYHKVTLTYHHHHLMKIQYLWHSIFYRRHFNREVETPQKSHFLT